MQQAKILLAEDSRSLALHITRILATQGGQVTVAVDGQAAWEHLAADAAYDVIILDLEMPRMNGWELLRHIKSTPALSQIPVIMQTATQDSQSIRRGLAEGAYYYLTKPFVPEVLLSIVGAALTQYRDYRALRDSVRRAERPFAFMQQARFRFQTLEDGRQLGHALATACPDPERVVLGLQELLVNAVEHGNLGISYAEKSELVGAGRWLEEVQRRQRDPEYGERWVTVTFAREDQAVDIVIRDQGAGFDWRNYLEFSAERAFDSHGRGIAMARAMSFDDLRYQGNGNTVQARVIWPAA